MKRLAMLIPLSLVLLAQDAKKAEPKPELSDSDAPVSGTVDVGYRAVSTGGNQDVYRSIINQREGPRLLDTSLHFNDSTRKLFDSADLKASGWGGDPWSTVRFEMYRAKSYRLVIDQRRLAYYNNLPSYANPRASIPGVPSNLIFSQRSYDTYRDLSDVQFDLRPGTRIVPFFALGRDSGSGTGVTDFYTGDNNYPVSSHLADRTYNIRGGVTIDFGLGQLLLEQGGTRFRDDQQLSTGDPNPGNRSAPLRAGSPTLSNVIATYRTRGDSKYSRGVITTHVGQWLDFNGQFLFSQPEISTAYNDSGTVRFLNLGAVVSTDQFLNNAGTMAKQPHTSGGISLQVRPISRIRILESLVFDHLNLASSVVTAVESPITTTFGTGDRLLVGYQQQQVDVLVDVNKRLTVRAGHRYSWGNARVRTNLFSDPTLLFDRGELRQNAGLFGITYRLASTIRLNASGEVSKADSAYFRISLRDYKKYNIIARYQPRTWLNVQVRSQYLTNENSQQTGGYRFTTYAHGAALQILPASGRIGLLLDYTRASIATSITYLVPQFYDSAISRYTDGSHNGTALVDWRPFSKNATQLSAGGSFYYSSGSRPTRYYQPVFKLIVPVHSRLALMAEYKNFNYAEPFYRYEGFRSNQFTAGFRFRP